MSKLSVLHIWGQWRFVNLGFFHIDVTLSLSKCSQRRSRCAIKRVRLDRNDQEPPGLVIAYAPKDECRVQFEFTPNVVHATTR
jgi:hypothetical protein